MEGVPMSKSLNFAVLAVGAAALAIATSPASATTFPAIGNSTAPYDVINVDNSGSGGSLAASFLGGGNQVAYEGSDDVYYGIVNNSTSTINNISLTGTGAFAFEGNPTTGGDGIGAGPWSGTCTTTAPCSPVGSHDTTAGYGGPIGYFGNISAALDSGTVFFYGGLAPGASTVFALELPASILSVTGINNVSTTPIPAALPLFASGLGGLGLLGWRRKRKKAAALAA
jgi:hypothetical protein